MSESVHIVICLAAQRNEARVKHRKKFRCSDCRLNKTHPKTKTDLFFAALKDTVSMFLCKERKDKLRVFF